MNNFIFENATKVYFGKGCVKEYLSSLSKEYGDTIMLAYGGGSIKKNGIYDEVTTILKASGKNIVEFPAEEYWRLFCELIQALLAQSGICAEQIAALAISSQGETLFCLDSAGQPQGNGIVWLDNRAFLEADQLRERFGRQAVYEKTGQADMTATWPAAKILWLRKNRPQEFARTHKFLLLEDYLLYRLTGRYVGEPNLWASSAMLDIHTARWWPEMLETLGLDAQRLPEILPCGSAVGCVTARAARIWGWSPPARRAPIRSGNRSGR